MVDFRRRRTFQTDQPTLLVDGGLPVGTHVFSLVVEDESGRRSQPASVTLSVVRARGPADGAPDGGGAAGPVSPGPNVP